MNKTLESVSHPTPIPTVVQVAALKSGDLHPEVIHKESYSLFNTLYSNRIYIYIFVVILLLCFLGYHLYKKYITKPTASDLLKNVKTPVVEQKEAPQEEVFKPTEVELEQVKKMNELQREQMQREQLQREQLQREQVQREQMQQVKNNNDRIQVDMNTSLDYENANAINLQVNELGEDENIQQYNLSQAEINELTKSLE